MTPVPPVQQERTITIMVRLRGQEGAALYEWLREQAFRERRSQNDLITEALQEYRRSREGR